MARKHSDHLWERGKQWYFRMAVPRELHSRIVSDSGTHLHMVTKALGDSESQARRKRDLLVVIVGGLFDRAKKGELVTPDMIKEAMSSIDRDPYTQLDDITRDLALRLNPFESVPQHWTTVIQTIAGKLGIPLGQPVAAPPMMTAPVPAPVVATETISQAAEAWYAQMQNDPSAAVRQETLDGHKHHVQAFIDHCGDMLLTDVTRQIASDFLAKVATRADGSRRSNRTVNKYAQTLKGLFQSARYRGRFTGDNPFEGQKRKAGGESYVAFTVPELQKLFGSFRFEISPKHHTPETALPWVSLIAAYTGMRLEEICQLSTADIRDEGANGATVTCIHIHNGGKNHLKNAGSARLVPVHSALVRAGLLRYRDSLPKGSLLFPGLKSRASKGNKVGARIGELFRKRLERLGLKRKLVCFHSFRHTVGNRLRQLGIPEDDRAALLGHTEKHITSRIYGQEGPGLKRLAGVVEAIQYEGLRLPTAV